MHSPRKMMLLQIGKRRDRPDDLIDKLLECHSRIRHFTDLASRLASVESPPDDEVVSTARSIERYFRESLPLHVRDEEESLLPTLRGRDRMLDGALDTMAREHKQHEATVARLVAVTGGLVVEPSSWAARKQELALLSRALEEQFDTHLQQEEELVFPAVMAFLTAAERNAIALEIAARRGDRER